MLDARLKEQLRQHLDKISQPVELVATLDAGQKSRDLQALLQEIAELSERVTLRTDGDEARTPSFAIRRPGEDSGVIFAGIPLGHEFTSLVLALLQVGGHRPRVSDAQAQRIRALDEDLHFETYYSLSCQNCPDVVQALNLMAVLNPRVRHVAVDGALFQEEVSAREVMSVPAVFLNGEPFDQGRMTLDQILARVDSASTARETERLNAMSAFDVLVVGGGPAGAAAAIYAARKGVRTGLAAERLGGQVLDTQGIENLISVPHTLGPKLAADLEAHVRQYDVDLMDLQRAVALVPAQDASGLHEVRFESGACLRSKSVILATGARWREMGVPGEREYRGHGVAYCPHCDGPLFKGKRVAVIGGGNSGVEAAIDLAGMAAQVTLVEFMNELRADAVLQEKLRALPNVQVIRHAQTTRVEGDGSRVTGLTYKDRDTDAVHTLSLDGIFVQIGLVPNTEWLQGGAVELSGRGEIVTNAHGMTTVPGVFAAGDVTTVPYKQIVIAMGEGARAALGAFDHLIRR